MAGAVTTSAQLSSWSLYKGQMAGELLSMVGSTAPCAPSPAAAHQIALIITDPWCLFHTMLIIILAIFQPR